jgi:hypothetical protein
MQTCRSHGGGTKKPGYRGPVLQCLNFLEGGDSKVNEKASARRIRDLHHGTIGEHQCGSERDARPDIDPAE